MSADVQWTEVDVLVQGLNERIDPRVLPQGELVEVLNGEYSRPGGIRKRPGTSLVASGSTNLTPGATALVRHDSELLLLDADGSQTTEPRLWVLDEDASGWRSPVEIPTATLRLRPVAADLSQPLKSDVAYANGYLVYAVALSTPDKTYVRIRDAITGALIREVSAGSGSSAPRCAASGTTVVVTWQDSAGDIFGVTVDTTATPPTVSSATTLANDHDVNHAYHDIIGITGDNFAMVYRRTTSGDLHFKQWSNALILQNAVTFGAADSRVATLVESGSNVFINWRENDEPGIWRYAAYDAVSWANTLAITTWYTETGSPLEHRSAVSASTNGSVLLFHSQQLSSGDAHMLRWRHGDDAGVLGATQQKRNCLIAGKPWRRTSGFHHHIWVVVGGVVDNTARTYALLDVPESTGKALLSISTLGGVVGTDSTVQGLPWSTAFDGSNYRGTALAQYIALETRTGPRELVVSYSHLGRYQSAEFGGQTYMACGAVTQWEGARLSEVGFAVPPEVEVTAVGSGGTFAAGDYQYAVLYETVDPVFGRHRSAASEIKTVTVVSNGSVDIEIEPLTVTRRFWGPNHSHETPRVICTIYRSANAGDTTLQRLHTFQALPAALISDAEATTAITLTDTGSAPGSDEVLYTTGGELENDPIEGGGTAIVTHKDRLWVGGGEDGEVLWYSKPQVGGRPAEFSIGQQLRIPGENVVALASLDDALVAFCERGIYAVFGDGPNARGVDGVFSTPMLVDAHVGCIGPRSVVVAQPGAFFQSSRGIELLDRGRNVVYIGGAVESTLATYPRVLAAVAVPLKGQVRFAVSNSNQNDGRVLVFDYVEQKWAVWDHAAGGAPWTGMATWNTALATQRGVAMLDRAGDLYEESSGYLDNASTYTLRVETGWLSFGRLNGYKRVRKVHPLVQRIGSHGLDVRMSFRYDDAATATRSWSAAEITTIGAAEPLRVYVPQPKQTSPAIKVRLAEVADGDSAGFAVQGLSFEVGMIPGLRRLPAANTR